MSNCYDFPANAEWGTLLWTLNATGEIYLSSWDKIKESLESATPSNNTQQMLTNFFANSNRTQYYDANNMNNMFDFPKYVVEPMKESVCIPSEYQFSGGLSRFAATSNIFILLLIHVFALFIY